jgi:hypothetical protein
MFLFLWLLCGILTSWFSYWAWRLSFRCPVTLGTIAYFAIGIVLPPLSLFCGIVVFLSWAFDPFESNAVKWSPEWTKFRYKQHCWLRNLWYLGNPPQKETLLSGWSDYKNKV